MSNGLRIILEEWMDGNLVLKNKWRGFLVKMKKGTKKSKAPKKEVKKKVEKKKFHRKGYGY